MKVPRTAGFMKPRVDFIFFAIDNRLIFLLSMHISKGGGNLVFCCICNRSVSRQNNNNIDNPKFQDCKFADFSF